MESAKGVGKLTDEQGRFLVVLARNTIMKKLQISPPTQDALAQTVSPEDPVLQTKRGVFVTLHANGQLRGCIGSLVGDIPIVEGVRLHAINAAFNDYRFAPVGPDEFAGIEVEVSILSKPRILVYEGAGDLVKGLHPGIDGVIIKKGEASATFLPQVWKQVSGVEEFLSHLCLKAGLPVDEWRLSELEMMTYQVQCFTED